MYKNILMSFLNDKKKVEIMLKKNAEVTQEQWKMLLGPRFKEVLAKSLTSKNKSRELFGNLKEQGTLSGSKAFGKQQLIQGSPFSCQRK